MRIGNLGTIYSSQRSCYPSDGSLSKRFSSTAAPANKNSGVPNGNNNSSFFQLFMIGCTAVAAASTFRFSACSEGTGGASAFEPTTLPSHSDIDLPQMKPLWPDGVSEADVDDLVEVILQDPSINIALIPDSIEAAIYKSTIRLTLNIFYRLLSRLNGVSLLSHQIKVARIQQSNDGDIELIGRSTDRFASKNHKRITAVALKSNARVNDQVLETVAERLLANRAINHTLIPDAIELQLYQNCLKVIFRALQILSNSFHINICGHDIQLSIEPSSLEQSALAATSSSPSNFRMGSEIDMELLQEFAFRAGIPKDGSVELSWWDEVLSRRRFVASLHASLYSLVLGIVDDVSTADSKNAPIRRLFADLLFFSLCTLPTT